MSNQNLQNLEARIKDLEAYNAEIIQELNQKHELIFQHEMLLAKSQLVVKATKIGLWDTEFLGDDPFSPDNVFIWSDEFRQMLGFEDENDFPNVQGSWSNR
ncbi:MAG: hypothetical protein LBC71_06865, partial [Oscillospiraceae bacterium]|nr:hypothetical protein [Oscillospiraceae bacterium]